MSSSISSGFVFLYCDLCVINEFKMLGSLNVLYPIALVNEETSRICPFVILSLQDASFF